MFTLDEFYSKYAENVEWRQPEGCSHKKQLDTSRPCRVHFINSRNHNQPLPPLQWRNN
jgi:hypothetical protein